MFDAKAKNKRCMGVGIGNYNFINACPALSVPGYLKLPALYLDKFKLPALYLNKFKLPALYLDYLPGTTLCLGYLKLLVPFYTVDYRR